MAFEQKRTPVAIHVGLPKTGTTSMQELCFEQHPDIRYFGQSNLWENKDAKQILATLLVEEQYINNIAETRKLVFKLKEQGKAIVISDEAITFGEFMLRANTWDIISDHFTIAKRAHEIFGDVHIFIVLRNQADWLQSWQRQGLKTAKYVETDFEKWLENDIGVKKKHLFELLDYNALYNAYVNVFGKENVHVRFYEDYVSKYEDLAVDFVSILGVDPERTRGLISSNKRNVSGRSFRGLPKLIQKIIRNDTVKPLLKVMPRRLRKSLRSILEVEKRYASLTDSQHASIMRYFSESNAALFRQIGIADKKLNYIQ
jgi:hypothetical protein